MKADGPKKCCDKPNRLMGLVEGDLDGVMVANWHCTNCRAHWTENVVGKEDDRGVVLLTETEKN